MEKILHDATVSNGARIVHEGDFDILIERFSGTSGRTGRYFAYLLTVKKCQATSKSRTL